MLVLTDQPAENLPAPDSLVAEVRGEMIGAWWAKLQCSMWPAAVVVGGVPGQALSQVSFAEDQGCGR